MNRPSRIPRRDHNLPLIKMVESPWWGVWKAETRDRCLREQGAAKSMNELNFAAMVTNAAEKFIRDTERSAEEALRQQERESA